MALAIPAESGISPEPQKPTCPFCKKPVAVDARLCVHCNGPIFNKGNDAAEPFCPRCKAKLKVWEIEGGDHAEVCEQCHGLWLDVENFKRSINPMRVPEKFIDSKQSWHEPASVDVKYLGCPRCGRFMNRENFSQISGIVIDHCKDHGVWLDAGEMDRIRLFIGSGGLEMLQDKKLDGLDGKLQELAGRTNKLDFTIDLLHHWNFKRIFFQGLKFP